MQSTETGFDTLLHSGQSQIDGLFDMMVANTPGGGVRESHEEQQQRPRPQLDSAGGGARASEKRGGCSTASISSGHVNCLADASNGSDKFDTPRAPLRRIGRSHTLGGGRPRRSVSFFEQYSPRPAAQQHSPRRVHSHSKSSLSVSFIEDQYLNTSPLLKHSSCSSMSSLPNSAASTPTTSFIGSASTAADSPHFSFASAISFGSPGPAISFDSNPDDHDGTLDTSSYGGGNQHGTPQQQQQQDGHRAGAALSSASSTNPSSTFDHSMNFGRGAGNINNGSDLANSVPTSSAGAYFSPGPPLARRPTATGARQTSAINLDDDQDARSNGCFESSSWPSVESAADERWSNPGSVQIDVVGQPSDQFVDGLHDDRRQQQHGSPVYVAAASSTVVQRDVMVEVDSFDYHSMLSAAAMQPTMSRSSSTGSSSHESAKMSDTENNHPGVDEHVLGVSTTTTTSTAAQTLRKPGLSNEYLQLHRRMHAQARRAGRFKSDPQIQTSAAFNGSGQHHHHHSLSLQEQDYQVPQFHEGRSCPGTPETPTAAGQQFDGQLQQPDKRKSPLQNIHRRSPSHPGATGGDTRPDSARGHKSFELSAPDSLVASPPAPSVVTVRPARSHTVTGSPASASASAAAPHPLSLAQRRLLRRQKSRDLTAVRKQLSSDRRKMDATFKQQAYRSGMAPEAIDTLISSSGPGGGIIPPADFDMMDTDTYPAPMTSSFGSYSTNGSSSEDLPFPGAPSRHPSLSSLQPPLIADDFDASNLAHLHSAEDLHRAFHAFPDDWPSLPQSYAPFDPSYLPPPSPMHQDSPPPPYLKPPSPPAAAILSPPDSPGYAFSCASPGYPGGYAPPPTPGYAHAVDMVFSSLGKKAPRRKLGRDVPARESATFVNFTPKDATKILSGVAPSGSSKTKARREKEASERRRRIGEVVEREVVRVGGDGRGVRERVELL